MQRYLPWLALKSVPGIGDLLFKRLIERFHSPVRVFEAPVSALGEVQGISRRLAQTIHRQGIPDTPPVGLAWALEQGLQLLTLTDSDYPALLQQIPDPPPILYVAGTLGEEEACLAVVGSRDASPYGLKTAQHLSRQLAGLGITIVSGLALGIDTAAHQGALAGRGRTVAVLGCGLDVVYPRQNQSLFKEIIATGGAVISEFPPGTLPDGRNFPKRNRIISGMSYGTVVVEAARRSGSLITARLAAEQNREVFAVPGAVGAPKSTGTHALIKQGAKLVEQVSDITEEIRPFMNLVAQVPIPARTNTEPKPQLSTTETSVMAQLQNRPTHIDAVIQGAQLTASTTAAALLHLELKGVIEQLPGKYFVRY